MESEEGAKAGDVSDKALKEGGDATGAEKDWLDVLEAMESSDEYAQAVKQGGDGAGDAKDWFDVLATLNLDDAARVAKDEDFSKDEGWADFLSKLQQSDGEGVSWGLIPTVDALDVNRFTGRWYQVRVGSVIRAQKGKLGLPREPAQCVSPGERTMVHNQVRGVSMMGETRRCACMCVVSYVFFVFDARDRLTLVFIRLRC